MVIKVAVPNQFKLKIIPGIRTFLFPDHREIHYIGGSEILPAPLSPEKEEATIRSLKNGDANEARKLLIEHNLRLVVYIAKKFDNTGVGVEDLISIGTIGLIKAINTYKLDKKIKLATYASKCIENEILMYLRTKKKSSREVSLYEPIGTDREGNEIQLFDVIETEGEDAHSKVELKEDIRMLYQRVEKELTPRERTVLKLRYGLYHEEEYTQKEIARRLGISRSYVSRIEKGAIAKLRGYFEM